VIEVDILMSSEPVIFSDVIKTGRNNSPMF